MPPGLCFHPLSSYHRQALAALAGLAALLASGCATHATINPNAFAPPKTAVIADIPKMKVVATVGVTVPWAPGFPGFHFSERADYYFLAGNPQGPTLPDHAGAIADQAQQQVFNQPSPPRPATAAGAAAAGAVVGAIIQGAAAETFRKSQTFGADVQKLFPDYNLRDDFLLALKAALERRGIAVKLTEGGTDKAPRMLWPARDAEGNRYETGPLEGAPAVDADVLVQVSPLAFYNAPGPLNAYRRNVSVGIALYNGRTRQFIGRQTVWFTSPDGRFEYSKYDSLVEDLPAAAPALREALLSLAPRVAEIVGGRPTR